MPVLDRDTAILKREPKMRKSFDPNAKERETIRKRLREGPSQQEGPPGVADAESLLPPWQGTAWP